MFKNSVGFWIILPAYHISGPCHVLLDGVHHSLQSVSLVFLNLLPPPSPSIGTPDSGMRGTGVDAVDPMLETVAKAARYFSKR